MTWQLDRFCRMCGMNLENMDAIDHVLSLHLTKTIKLMYETLPFEQQDKLIDKLVEVRPKDETKLI